MQNSFTPTLRFFYKVALIISSFLFFGNQVNAQCFDNTDFDLYPSSQAFCQGQLTYMNVQFYGTHDAGEIRVYDAQSQGSLLQSLPINSNDSYSGFEVYPEIGTVWVAFYNSNTGCETLLHSFTFEITGPYEPYLEYARECGDGTARIQVSGGYGLESFYLLKWEGGPVDGYYTMIDGNNSGYFEIPNYNSNDGYAFRMFGGCTDENIYPFNIQTSGAQLKPTITGDTTVYKGTMSSLTANGNSDYYVWYADGYSSTGPTFLVPSDISIGEHTLNVTGYSSAGCVSQVSNNINILVIPQLFTDTSVNNQNYIRTRILTRPLILTGAAADSIITLSDVQETTQYSDGLGRPLQTVIKQGSMPTGGTAKDLVSVNLYDRYGLEPRQYLPFPANNAGANTSLDDGRLKKNPLQQQAVFYNSANPQSPIAGQGETFFYSEQQYEPSPRGRVVKTMAPGNNWVGSGKGVETKTWYYTENDSVIKWRVADNPISAGGSAGGFGTYLPILNENAGNLSKIVTINENGKQTIQFIDETGKQILSKVQLTASPDTGTGSGYAGWLCTYYIYDEFSRLRCVIQPKGVEELSKTNWQMTTSLLDEQCFRYEYDIRSRLIQKKIPGAGATWMVYDKKDRMVMSQDANMRLALQKTWMYTQYDNFNRPIATGLLTDNSNYNNLVYHVNAAQANSTDYPNLASYTTEELNRTFYDSYSWLATWGNPLSGSYDNAYNQFFQAASNTQWPYAQSPTTHCTTIKGNVTGTRIKVLGTSTYLFSVIFYDDKGRAIQVQSQNYTEGADIVTTQYNWAGQPLVVINKTVKAGTAPQTTVAVSQLTYDALGRLVKTEKKLQNTLVNNNAFTEYTTISTLEYDALGQVKKKTIGSKKDPTTNEYLITHQPLQELAYDYNIRGWLLGANREFIKGDGDAKFGFELAYDKKKSTIDNYSADTYNKTELNGNVAGIIWKSAGDGEKRKYDFNYDAANRLLKADFTQNNAGWNTSAGVD
jgi:hypothetical protein